MSDYFSSAPTFVASTAVLFVDTSTKDRLVFVAGYGNGAGSSKIGFTSTTAVYPSVGSFMLPAGMQVWGLGATNEQVAVLVTKSPASVSICG